MNIVLQIILITLFALIILSIPAAIFEDNQVRLFSRSVYRLGIPVYINAIFVKQVNPSVLDKEVYTMDEGVYHFAVDGNIYFHSLGRQKMMGVFTPFRFKCRAVFLSPETVEIHAVLPLAPTILFISTFVLGLIFCLPKGSPGLPFVISSIVVFTLSHYIEKKRLKKMLLELRFLLGKGV